MICTVTGYSQKEAKRIDEARTPAGLPTRFARPGVKKREPVSISREQAERLKAQPDSAKGKRNGLLMCLLLDHSLRCGEVAY